MPCAIQSGYTIDCRDSIGGVECVFITEFGNVSNIIDASGLVTGLTKATGKRFWKFEIPRATANTTSNATASEENGSLFFTHQVVFPINKRDATVRNIVTTIAKNKCLVVTKDMDGKYRMYGKNYGLYLTTNESGSGTAPGDRNGNNLTLSGVDTEDFFEVTAAVGAALETPGS